MKTLLAGTPRRTLAPARRDGPLAPYGHVLHGAQDPEPPSSASMRSAPPARAPSRARRPAASHTLGLRLAAASLGRTCTVQPNVYICAAQSADRRGRSRQGAASRGRRRLRRGRTAGRQWESGGRILRQSRTRARSRTVQRCATAWGRLCDGADHAGASVDGDGRGRPGPASAGRVLSSVAVPCRGSVSQSWIDASGSHVVCVLSARPSVPWRRCPRRSTDVVSN